MQQVSYIDGLAGMLSMKNFDEFRAFVKNLHAITLNITYADVAGNIGYALSGVVPLRSNGYPSTLPLDGSVSASEWTGFVPVEEMPHCLNPEQGIFALCLFVFHCVFS